MNIGPTIALEKSEFWREHNMAFVLANRVQETTITTGTDYISLDGPEASFQSFVSGIGLNNSCYYCIESDNEWEAGIGTVFDAGGDVLSRDVVLSSSNGGAKVNFGAGSKNVFCTQPAERAIFRDGNGITHIGDGAGNEMEVRADGEISLKGTARIEKDVGVPLSDVTKVGPTPAFNDEDNFLTIGFDKNFEESVYFRAHTPSDLESGTDIAVHTHFIVDSVDTGTQRAVVWGVEFKVIQHGQVFDFDTGTTTIGFTSEIPVTTVDKEVIVCDNLVLPANDLPGEGELLVRLYRNATHVDDDHNGDARLTELCLSYISDRLGEAT